ncbi:MAG: hypothetical protein JJ895_12655 [Balneolaceae bacterium]|nr:hypothetical protein [Balneolaceae bacterium]
MKFLTRRINEWLILIGAFLLVAMAGGYLVGTYIMSPAGWNNLFHPSSSFVLSFLSSQNAIAVFTGDEIESMSAKMMFIIYCIIFIYLIVGPWLLYNGFKKSRAVEEFKKPWQWYVGGIICIASLSVIPTTAISFIVAGNTMDSALESRALDQLREDVFDTGFDLAQKVISDKNPSEYKDLIISDQVNSIGKVEFETVIPDSFITIVAWHKDFDVKVKADIKPYEDDFLIIRN